MRIYLACCCAGGTRRGDKQWLQNKIKNFAVVVDGKKKPKFQYHLPLLGKCCRSGWILAVGMSNPKNARVQSIEAAIRKGNPTTVKKKSVPKAFFTRTNHAKAFIEEFMLLHCQKSPSATLL